ncbi:Kdo hydroxylase family protein [Chitinimonas sp. DQS-5]|uniref:Kdo hydroxylase family protein n=2 Tax=Parachitinimonas caeni TaxID=3031301 RepID=A0ABT7DU63_9NEIS|nr:Kdo hydroxylase family protein [Parachitinimonas caeni]
MQNRLMTLNISQWDPEIDPQQTNQLASALEDGKVLYLPQLAFRLNSDEERFLSPSWSNGRAKNISFESKNGQLKGAHGNEEELKALGAMISRYRSRAVGLIQSLLPHYSKTLQVARTSFRPFEVAGRPSSRKKDDTRLHVDAFPSRPNHGERILRVFCNINPDDLPRRWRVGQDFTTVAQRFLPGISRPFPGSAAILQALGITKSRRSEYDHLMLHLHDAMKADNDYQIHSPQLAVDFPPGSVWICFSDQTPHAAMSGQFLLEQTLHLPVSGLYDPSRSPLKVLEQLCGRALI